MGVDKYFTGMPCKHGHIAERYTKSTNCLICQKLANLDDENKLRRSELAKTDIGRLRSKERSSKFHKANRDKILLQMKERNKVYYQNNKEKIKKATLQYQKDNASARNKYKSNWNKNKKQTDPNFASLLIMRKMIARCCERIRMNRKEIGRTVDALGYTTEQFKSHIEKQFTAGMSWLNHGEWHVDHIIPLSSFNLNEENERLTANGLTNLMPIWAKDNFKKSDNIYTLF